MSREITDWNRETGKSIAAEEGIEMTDAHQAVIDFLRNQYSEHGADSNGSDLAQALASPEQGGKAKLHQLFPDGPVAQVAESSACQYDLAAWMSHSVAQCNDSNLLVEYRHTTAT